MKERETLVRSVMWGDGPYSEEERDYVNSVVARVTALVPDAIFLDKRGRQRVVALGISMERIRAACRLPWQAVFFSPSRREFLRLDTHNGGNAV